MKKLILFLFICNSGFAQNILQDIYKDYKTWQKKRWDSEQIYEIKGFGLMLQNVQQQSFSLNQYTGNGIGYFSSKTIERPKYEKGSETYVGFTGNLQSKNGDSKSLSGNFSVGRQYLRKLNQNFALGALSGLNVSVRFNQNYPNNSISTEAFLSLSPKIHFRKDIKILRKEFRLDYNLATAITSVGFWTPTYTANFTNNKPGLFLPNKYNNINSRLLIMFPAKKRVASIRPIIGYGYNLQAITPGNSPSVINGSHTVYFIAKLQKIK